MIFVVILVQTSSSMCCENDVALIICDVLLVLPRLGCLVDNDQVTIFHAKMSKSNVDNNSTSSLGYGR